MPSYIISVVCGHPQNVLGRFLLFCIFLNEALIFNNLSHIPGSLPPLEMMLKLEKVRSRYSVAQGNPCQSSQVLMCQVPHNTGPVRPDVHIALWLGSWTPVPTQPRVLLTTEGTLCRVQCLLGVCCGHDVHFLITKLPSLKVGNMPLQRTCSGSHS